MNTRKFDWKTFRWFLLAGSVIGFAMTKLPLECWDTQLGEDACRYGFPVSFTAFSMTRQVGIPETLGIFVPNAFVWSLLLYLVFWLVKWLRGHRITIEPKME